MAEVIDDDYQEYYAHFIRIDGERGTALVFATGNWSNTVGTQLTERDWQLAREIAEIIDRKE